MIFVSNFNDKDSKGDESEFKPDIKEPSLFFCLVKIFYGKFLSGAFLKLIQDSLNFVGPVILKYLLLFISYLKK